MTVRLTILTFVLLFVCSARGQINVNEIRQQVLVKSIVDSLFVFGKWADGGREEEMHLKYLGQVPTSDGRVFKVMNSILFWGLSHRATSRVLIFNDKNQYLGNYYLYMTNDLPDKLEDGKLIFTNKTKEECDKSIVTIIDLTKGLPKEIFLRCEGNNGDFHAFSSE